MGGGRELDAEERGAHGGACLPAILMDGPASGGRLALVEVVERPGLALPRHAHHWEDEALYVLAGAIALWRDGSWRVVPRGASAFVPRGAEHAIVALTEEARLLTTLAPAGFEGFYRELGGNGCHELPLDRLVALAARYGCEVTGGLPPLPAGIRRAVAQPQSEGPHPQPFSRAREKGDGERQR